MGLLEPRCRFIEFLGIKRALKKKSFTKFELVIIGNWKGKTENNGRKFGPESGMLGIQYNLADKSPSNKIAPTFIDLYNAEWVQHP